MAFGLDARLFRDDFPGQHRTDIAALFVERADQEVQDLTANLDFCLMRQIAGIREQFSLVFGVLVKDVDALTDNVLGLTGEDMLNPLQALDRGFVHIGDCEILEIADHDRDGHIVHHCRVGLAVYRLSFGFLGELSQHQYLLVDPKRAGRWESITQLKPRRPDPSGATVIHPIRHAMGSTIVILERGWLIDT